MAVATDSVIEIVKRYLDELEAHDIHVQEAILFGSHMRGDPKEESDIDVALISTAFTGDWFDDRRIIVPLRRGIDSRIEPIPFRPEDFFCGGNFIDEIKKTGKKINVR